jgi:hypothetical protein
MAWLRWPLSRLVGLLDVLKSSGVCADIPARQRGGWNCYFGADGFRIPGDWGPDDRLRMASGRLMPVEASTIQALRSMLDGGRLASAARHKKDDVRACVEDWREKD